MTTRVFAARLRGLFFGRRMERQMEDELLCHLEMQTEDNIRMGMKRRHALMGGLIGMRRALPHLDESRLQSESLGSADNRSIRAAARDGCRAVMLHPREVRHERRSHDHSS